MGVQISSIIPSRELKIEELAGKKVALDAFNILYQFISIIRDRFTGEPLKDHSGNITSHLSGILYRSTNLIEAGVKPIFVFDGKPPYFKKRTLDGREKIRSEAKVKWDEAVAKGESAYKYAQAASRLTGDMIEEAKKLLDYMGIPYIQASSEGEATCSYLCKKGEVFATGSQDSDSLLFGSPRLIRNLSISGRRKLPKKETYIDINPELIELEKVLGTLGITREQLIIAGMLIGTDYNEGIKGVGPKTALKIVKEYKTLDEVLAHVTWQSEINPKEVFDFFMNPPVTEDYKLEWKEPDKEKIIKFMVTEHDFSRERMEKIVEKLLASSGKASQSSLGNWFKK